MQWRGCCFVVVFCLTKRALQTHPGHSKTQGRHCCLALQPRCEQGKAQHKVNMVPSRAPRPMPVHSMCSLIRAMPCFCRGCSFHPDRHTFKGLCPCAALLTCIPFMHVWIHAFHSCMCGLFRTRGNRCQASRVSVRRRKTLRFPFTK